MVVWTLPFLWIGLSMSVRRAMDAGRSPWIGLLFVAPFVNYVVMAALAVVPSRPAAVKPPRDPREATGGLMVKSALLGILVGLGIAMGMAVISVFALGSYGSALFLGTPLFMGAAAARIFNNHHRYSMRSTLLVSCITVLVVAGAFIVFALEGAICLAMAFPPAIVMAWFGAVIGRAMAEESRGSLVGLALMVLCLPLMAAAEPGASVTNGLHEVISTIEVDVPPEQVWPNVIGFGELPPPSEFIFDLGIAYPVRADIDGSGVGAVRRCEFSTGPFVEPITTWDAPNRLAFGVTSQPPPMTEMSPYRAIHPPHIDGYFRSRRGEFRLVALPGGRTRLEGSTFYELDLFPQSYWTLWSNALVHAIHNRVLTHVKARSEGLR